MSVCLSVCLSHMISSEPHARFLPIFVHAAFVRGSVALRHVYDRPHRLLPGRDFSSPLTMHYNALAAKGIIRSPIASCSTRYHSVVAAFAENGIGREGGDGSAQRGQCVIYDCLTVLVLSSCHLTFSAVTLWFGRQADTSSGFCKNCVIRCWRGYPSGKRCK